ncbi:ARF GAP-like zinc finger-containing protein [Mycena indigotica]|uniref:ARF GAP-like zinc finger-containing protein n=1 Tax=Mycena indigotica TaxID=2126181 RepID=A0A8H6VWT5_9AGAR|nr:ARF GAP-like zinc finger-containing protein [Mycena indigotica]KAF7293043.1 ARF GAP-like zinc finger-containing protein [Mycena indigotica]
MSVNKLAADRNQKLVLEIAALPGNDICADCKVRNPRWASYNLGIFICVNCASIHRKIGTHVSKVKSLTMDSWTKEQVDRMREMGNANSNFIYNPNETRHPPPPNLLDGERDSEMEQFVRSKYEYKSFVDRSALVASKLGPSRSSSSTAAKSLTGGPSTSRLPPRSSTVAAEPPKTITPSTSRSFSHPPPSSLASPPAPTPQQPPTQQLSSSQQLGGVWNDLISLQTPAMNSSLPLQVQANPTPAFLQPIQSQQPLMTGYQPQMMPMATGMGMGMGMAHPQFAPNLTPQSMQIPMQFQQQQPQFVAAPSPPILYNPQPQPFGSQPVQPMYGSPAPIQMTPSPVPMHTPSPGIGMQQPQMYQQQQPQFGGPSMGMGQQPMMTSQFMPPGMQMGTMGTMPVATGPQWMTPMTPNMGYMPQQQGQWGAM